jgi:hypothetical protein
VVPYFGNTPLCEITKPLADEFRQFCIRKTTVKETTVNRLSQPL